MVAALRMSMRLGIDYGRQHLEVEVPESSLVGVHRSVPAPPVADRAAAMRAALEKPLGFPALRRALTPDDHVTIVVDEGLPHLAELLTPLLEHISGAGIHPEAITLLCAPPASSQDWLDELPDAFQEVRVEVHDPSERRKLSYLATTSKGRRIYVNRTAVDADQLVVLSRRGYDPLLGYSGSEGALFPALSDEATRQELFGQLSMAAPDERSWPVHKEANEVAWLLGAPFMVQVIEGAGDEITHLLAGLADTGDEGQRLLNARWRLEVDRAADTVLAAIAGNPARQTFADLARAATAASRVVAPRGRILLITEANPPLGAGADILRHSEDPGKALELLQGKKPADMAAAFQWAHACQQAGIYLLSGLPAETVEELNAAPLDNASQVKRLLSTDGSCLVLADAHKTLALVRNSVDGP
jgi:nickel-dependent lactate racemase